MSLFRRLLQWFGRRLFEALAPRITFSKVFPEALEPEARDIDTPDYVIFAPRRLTLEPGERTLVNTGLVFRVPPYFTLLLTDASSTAYQHPLSVCSGIVDPAAPGGVSVILENRHTERVVVLPPGTPIARAVFPLTLQTCLIEEILPEDVVPKASQRERNEKEM